MKPKRVGYVGLNHHHAEPYLETLKSMSETATVTCACERDPSFDLTSVPSLGNVPVYEEFEAMLSSESLDAVFLTLPNRDTPAAIEQAIAADVDVFTEKPAARTAEELERLQSIVDSSTGTVCISYPWQSHPIVEDIRDLVETGFFGNLRAFDARFIASQVAFRDPTHFIFDEEASRGGILQWLGIHWIQLFTKLFDKPITQVNANIASRCSEISVEDGATLQLETEEKAIGTLQCGYYLAEGMYDTEINIYGSDGRCNWDPIGREFGFEGETSLKLDETNGDWESTPHRRIVHEYEPAPGYGGAWGRSFIESFFEACDGKEPSPVTLDDALTVLRILDAAYESADTGDWVRVDKLSS